MSKGSERGPVWQATRLRILNRDAWVCSFCAKPLEGPDATVDHVVPLIEGGRSTDDNLVAACRTCNGQKGGRLIVRSPWFNRRWLTSLPLGQ